jgi:hypothetical protein
VGVGEAMLGVRLLVAGIWPMGAFVDWTGICAPVAGTGAERERLQEHKQKSSPRMNSDTGIDRVFLIILISFHYPTIREKRRYRDPLNYFTPLFHKSI